MTSLAKRRLVAALTRASRRFLADGAIIAPNLRVVRRDAPQLHLRGGHPLVLTDGWVEEGHVVLAGGVAVNIYRSGGGLFRCDGASLVDLTIHRRSLEGFFELLPRYTVLFLYSLPQNPKNKASSLGQHDRVGGQEKKA